MRIVDEWEPRSPSILQTETRILFFLFFKILKQIYFIQEYLFSVALFVYHTHLYSFLCFEASAAVNIATLSLLVMQNITTDV